MELNLLMDQYDEGQNFLRARKQRQVNQLNLFNNLQRDEQSIAATTMFSLFNRVHSSLYSDTNTVVFIPTEDSDYKKTQALSRLQMNDYREMEKWKLDYDWLWNTCFYGDGFVSTVNWDKKRKLMVPEVMNNLMMIYDPFFAEPSEWRYYGQWIAKSGMELKRLARLGLLEKSFNLSDLQGGFDTEVWSYKTLHDQARLATGTSSESSSSHNQIYQLFESYTFNEDGERTIYWTDKNFSKILRKKKLPIPDDQPWPLVRKQIFREPNSSVSTSIPDVLEDKHRAKNVLYNLMYMGAKDEANPIYAYNPDIVKDVSQFFQRQIEQHIPMDDVDKGYKRLNLGPTMSNALLQFVNLLNMESTDAIGTTMVQPITPRAKKSATESALAQQIADLAASLQSKILGLGEKEFWSQWYQRHIENMKQADEKVITITNVSSVSFESIKVDDIKTKFPPKIEILSQRDADYKKLVKRRDWMQIYPILMKQLPPKSLNNLNKFVFFPQFIEDTSTIDRIVPKSVDEIRAEQENELLEADKLPKISPEDDDEVHLYSHYMAKKTSATWAHIFAHEQQWGEKQKKKEQQDQASQATQQPQPQAQQMPQFGQQPQQQNQNQQKSKKKVKNFTENNTEAAAPLMQETGDSLAKGRSANA